MSELISREGCPRKSFFDNLGTVSTKPSEYHIACAIKESVRNNDYSRTFLDEALGDEAWKFMSLAKEAEIDLLEKQLERYLNYMSKTPTKKLTNSITQDVNFDGKLITVSADSILEASDGSIWVVKLKRGEPKLTYAGRKESSIPEYSLELYLLYKMGKHLYPNKKVVASLHHMTSKKDTPAGLHPVFDFKPGENIISYDFSQDNTQEKYMYDRVVGLMNQKPDFNVMTSDAKNCQVCSYKNICHYKKPQEVELEPLRSLEKININFNLTKTQHAAIMFESGIVRINAGAGSGKTTTVARRVAELIQRGYAPENIILITFTNTAAKEMKTKISHWLKEEGVVVDESKLQILTFNSWGDKVIQENFELLGFSKVPKLIEKVEQYTILFEILGKYPSMEGFLYKKPLMNFRYSKGVVIELEKAFGFMKSHYVTEPGQLDGIVPVEHVSQVMNMYQEYNKILKERDLIEYQDQINLLIDLIETDSPVLDKYDYEHVIVDEFQDSDTMQMDLILYLSNKPKFKSLMIVGDDAQSIFGFRNTSQENILNFHKFFSDVKDINMIENFRSTPQVIALANGLDALNSKRIDKNLKSGLPNGPIPTVRTFPDSESEHWFMAHGINSLITGGEKAEKIAVIARTKGELFSLEEKLKALKIPYIIDIPEPLLNDTNIHIALSLAEFFNNTDITQGVLEYLHVVKDGFKGLSEDELRALLEEAIQELKDKMESEDGKDMRLELFFSMLEVIEDEVFEKFLEELKGRNLEFNELYHYLGKFIEYKDGKTLEKKGGRYKAVTLTTAHTSKGKEFENVFVTLSKFKVDTKLDKDIDEERRTLYVSITRAKRNLFITGLKGNNTKPNRFLDEIQRIHRSIFGTSTV